MRPPRPELSLPRRRAGFSLLVTVTLLVLLAVIAIGLLSLSSVTLRSATQGAALAEARANARLALALAIGELQRSAGPDQRITAPAAILDNNPLTEAVDGISEPNVTGVWRSHTFDPTDPAQGPDYDKAGRFERWMVSGLSEAELRDPDAFLGDPFRGRESAVRLVGAGTTGVDGTGSPLHTWAGKEAIRERDNTTAGRFAYAVLDEGAKARIDLDRSPGGLGPAETSLLATGAPLQNRFDLLEEEEQGEPLAGFAPTRGEWGRMITLPTGELLGDGLRPYFNDLTTDAVSVLADVANGGLRKDLSLFGALEQLPAGYANRRLYSDETSPFASDRGSRADPFVAGSADPYWAYIHDFLNARDRMAPPPRGLANGLPVLQIAESLPAGFRPGVIGRDGFQPLRGSQRQLPLAPVIVRCEVLFSFAAVELEGHGPWQNSVPDAFGEQWRGHANMCLWYTPLITLWNPYNVPIELDQPVAEISTPPVGFRFRRHRCSDRSIGPGYVNADLVPLDGMYVNPGQRYTKKFVMTLYGEVNPNGSASGKVVLQPGEVKLFSPAQSPNSTYSNIFDYRNNMTDRPGGEPIPAAPGFRGPQYGYSIDWTTGKGSVEVNGPAAIINPQAGKNAQLGVLGSLWSDEWDIEWGPAAAHLKDGAIDTSPFTVSLFTSAASRDRTGSLVPETLLSRISFDYGGDLDVLRTALTPPGERPNWPAKMSTHLPVVASSQVRVPYRNSTIPNWRVQPFMVLSVQAKTSNSTRNDEPFPARSWIHNNATRPISYVDLAKERQAWASHEIAFIPYKNGMATDAKVDRFDRSYALSGIYKFTGSTFGIHRELPILPVQSVAQLGHADLAASGYPGVVDHAVGSSFAHPLVEPGAVVSQPTNLRYPVIDHSYLANHRLWDSWYASTYGNYAAPYPRPANLQSVVSGFLQDGRLLANPRYQPWTGGRPVSELADGLAASPDTAANEGYLEAAATQLLRGGFNINSPSKAAWKAVLGGLSGETIALLDSAAGSVLPDGYETRGAYFSRQRLPGAPPNAPDSTPEAERFWQGGVELSPDELDALAGAIVREVKERGPFLSLAEFVNRRLGSPGSDPLYLKGALQAAIENAPPFGDLNANGLRAGLVERNTQVLDANDVQPNAYVNPDAATGSTSTGATGNLDQLAVLTQLGPFIQARSDTFKIRCYGESTNAAGEVLARVWLEAVVQRTPEYVASVASDPDPTRGNLPSDRPLDGDGNPSALLHPANEKFGRRFVVVSSKWLSPDEV